MKLDLLVIAAHPDDAEITCGGTIIKAADGGGRTGIVDLSRGELGTLGSPEDCSRDAAEAARVMGLAMRENLGLPDANIELTVENKYLLAAMIRKYQPHVVILPYGDKQRHPDHRRASLLGYDACYLAGLKKAELDGQPHRPHKIIYASSYIETQHTFFVDISDQFERKKKAVAAHRSQFDGSVQSRQIFKPDNDIFELMEIYHRRYGIEVGCRYAEAFYTIEPTLIDDITTMPVRSL